MEDVVSNTSLGIRASKDKIEWASVRAGASVPELVNHGRISLPRADNDEASRLAWTRTRIQQLVLETGAKTVVVRVSETFGRKSINTATFQRARLEGVVAEAATSSSAPVEFLCLSQIGRRCGDKKGKELLRGNECSGISYPVKGPMVREAIAAAVAGLEKLVHAD